MKIQLTRESWLVTLAKPYTNRSNHVDIVLVVSYQQGIYKGFCLNATQGRINAAPNENPTHSGKLARHACKTLHKTK